MAKRGAARREKHPEPRVPRAGRPARLDGLARDGHAVVEVKRWGNADLPGTFDPLASSASARPGFDPAGSTRAVAAVLVAGPLLSAADLAGKVPLFPALPAGGGPITALHDEQPLPGGPTPRLTIAVTGLFRDAWA